MFPRGLLRWNSSCVRIFSELDAAIDAELVSFPNLFLKLFRNVPSIHWLSIDIS